MIISMLKFVVHRAGASTPQGGALNPAFCTVRARPGHSETVPAGR